MCLIVISKPLNLTVLILLGLITSFVFACKKQKLDKCKPYQHNIENNDTACYYFDESNFALYEKERYQYSSPCLNPNNNDEFVCFFQDLETEENWILKHNLVTNETTPLVQTGLIVQDIAWGKQGYIAFSDINNSNIQQLWVMHDDGSELASFSPDFNHNYFPLWDDIGEYLYWTKIQSPIPNQPIITMRKSIHNETIDTLVGGVIYQSDFLNKKLLTFRTFSDGNYLGYYDFENEISLNESNFYKFFKVGILQPNDRKWSKFSTHFFANGGPNGTTSGIYRYDLNGNGQLLKQQCSSKQYSSLSVANDDKFILTSVIRRYPNPANSSVIVSYSTIWKIDLMTGQETQILPN